MSINKKDAETKTEIIVNNVLQENNLLLKILEGVKAKEDSIRYSNALALEFLSRQNPELIYPEWNFFIDLIKSPNAYHKSISISTISCLTKIDKANKFEQIFGAFFNLIDDKSVIVSRKLAQNAGKIVKNKPNDERKNHRSFTKYR